ncbi:MAG: hydroxyethylthiazole kinase [Bowdeniella nasicola]|nr:hydroxyethylthiazole kinase [Bowdeniella nasicola]
MTANPAICASNLAVRSGDLLQQLHESVPLVQVITNAVVTNWSANILLALGASPAMADVVGEAGVFARSANALLVNLGTPNPGQRDAIIEAVRARQEAGTTWVLDPVAVGALPVRTKLATELLADHPSVIRANTNEVLALAGSGQAARGVDATAPVSAAIGVADTLANHTGGVVAISGQSDYLTDGTDAVWVDNGDALLTQITGGGCALGAVVAAFVSLHDTTLLEASTAAHVCYGIAAEQAARHASGPGSFAVALLDALAGLHPAMVRDGARVRIGADECDA